MNQLMELSANTRLAVFFFNFKTHTNLTQKEVFGLGEKFGVTPLNAQLPH